jgi:hypothetical protein
MVKKKLNSCVEPAAGPITPEVEIASGREGLSQSQKEVVIMQAQVGKEAPNFEASAYHRGGFKNIKLSDYRGKWVLLCFYPGDFTFV